MRYVYYTLTTVIVLAAVGTPFLLARSGGDPPAEPIRRVEAEQHYYVLLSLVEVALVDARGKAWDLDRSPPDIYYEIHWQGQKVFESRTKKDTLVARWSNLSVGLGDVVGSVSLDDSIKAARITARPGDELEFAVYDADFLTRDLIGRFHVPVEDLQVGDQKWGAPAGSLVSVNCRVMPLHDVRFETLTR